MRTFNHGTIVFEDLKLKNMTKSAKGTVESQGKNVAQKRGLNRGLLGAALGEFKRMVEYKAVLYGAIVLGVNPWRSSVTCAVCDHYDPASRKGERFACTNPKCNNIDHADVNAAKVILARGLIVLTVDPTVTVCGGLAARGRPAKQKLRVVRRGTRRDGKAKV